MQTIFLTGATGYIGGTIASKLAENGYRVRGLVRSAESAALLAQRGIEPVLGGLDDVELLVSEARAADGVINTASADHAGAIHALLVGLEGSSKVLVHTSGSSVVGDDVRGSRRSDAVFDEDTPFVVAPGKQARRELDLLILGAASRGVRSVVICPSLIYGVGSGMNRNSVQIPTLVTNALEQGIVQTVGPGLNVWSNVHISDVADLYLLAIANAPAGSFYFAENGEASFGEIGEAIARRLGLGPSQALPPDIAVARWGQAKAYFSLGSNSRVRAVRARQQLAWSPRHASVTDWILNDMPVDAPSTTPTP
ncbi:NAD-dependent epimerase/dehydratase family protein [Variovorax robiniae]|uniref:NAD-dependent epimerase/dehydratase family protein n=1 Tax=Variovorax robiniae TaxID=1836199 RepID=A0ABU8XHC0_9BURK